MKEGKSGNPVTAILMSINKSKEHISGGVVDEISPFVINRLMSMHADTIYHAYRMTCASKHITPQMSYDYFFHSVERGYRYSPPQKRKGGGISDDIAIIQKHFNLSRRKAIEARRVLTDEDIDAIRSEYYEGGKID
jgi:hypothetical protein